MKTETIIKLGMASAILGGLGYTAAFVARIGQLAGWW